MFCCRSFACSIRLADIVRCNRFRTSEASECSLRFRSRPRELSLVPETYLHTPINQFTHQLTNQNARKALFICVVYTNTYYCILRLSHSPLCLSSVFGQVGNRRIATTPLVSRLRRSHKSTWASLLSSPRVGCELITL